MRTKGVARFFVHTVTVETWLGTNGYGADTFASPVTVPCFVEGKRRLVRNSTGAEVISETTLYTNPTSGALFAPDSRVTVNSVTTRVIVTATLTSGSLGLPDHVVVNLT